MVEGKRSLTLLQLLLLISIGSSWCLTRHDLKKDEPQADRLVIKDVDIVKTRRLAELGGVSQSWLRELVQPYCDLSFLEIAKQHKFLLVFINHSQTH